MDYPRIRGLTEWRPLALGSHAVVWAACQLSLDRQVAVKVYQRELAEDGRHRFLREAAAAGRLSARPGIVPTYDAGILPDDRPYLIMELCPGGSLKEWIQPADRPNEERVRQVGVRIADAVAAVHASGVLHRDIRPANILIDSYGHPKLADFGLASVAGADPALTEALPVVSAYAPPEALRMDPPTESGDIYSLAATLYALLAGGPPGPADGASAPLSDVSRSLTDVLLTALNDDPAARPTAVELRSALAYLNRPASSLAGVGGHQVSPPRQLPSALTDRPDTAAQPATPRRHGRRRAGVMALAAVALVAVIASGMSWLVGERAALGGPVSTTTNAGGLTSSELPSPASRASGSETARANAIEVERSTGSAEPLEIVRINGVYRGRPDTFVHVQRWEDGKWLTFPIPAKTGASGEFTVYIEMGQPGRYRLRVQDPATGTQSESFVMAVQD